ncbi:MAG: hypothetical protein OXF41_08055 [bacterium]|nr:hypothetical protein [bacterium]
MTLVHFPRYDGHLAGHVPPIRAAVEAFFAYKDLAPTSRRTYRAALDPLVADVGPDQPLAALTPRRRGHCVRRTVGGAVSGDLERPEGSVLAVRAFVSWCGERWPLLTR